MITQLQMVLMQEQLEHSDSLAWCILPAWSEEYVDVAVHVRT